MQSSYKWEMFVSTEISGTKMLHMCTLLTGSVFHVWSSCSLLTDPLSSLSCVKFIMCELVPQSNVKKLYSHLFVLLLCNHQSEGFHLFHFVPWLMFARLLCFVEFRGLNPKANIIWDLCILFFIMTPCHDWMVCLLFCTGQGPPKMTAQ
jgi:hypothetical protein